VGPYFVVMIIILIIIAARSGGRNGKYNRYFRARPCPHCSNKIPGEADVCEFCHRDVVPTWTKARKLK
jgi:hypothetical protein